MKNDSDRPMRRILVVDDMPDLHEDYRRILEPEDLFRELDEYAADFFGEEEKPKPQTRAFEVVSAMQGEEARDLVAQAIEEDRPFSMAFVDMRMPPGWDGVETIRECWKIDPDLECVICTAYTDYSLDEIVDILGETDKFIFLRKPFDSAEVKQLACALSRKREVEGALKSHLGQLEGIVRERTQALVNVENSARSSQELSAEMLAKLDTDMRNSTKNIVGKLSILWMQLQTRLNPDKLERAGRIWDSIEKEVTDIDSVIDYFASKQPVEGEKKAQP